LISKTLIFAANLRKTRSRKTSSMNINLKLQQIARRDSRFSFYTIFLAKLIGRTKSRGKLLVGRVFKFVSTFSIS